MATYSKVKLSASTSGKNRQGSRYRYGGNDHPHGGRYRGTDLDDDLALRL